MDVKEKNEKHILKAVDAVKTKMFQVGMDYDNHQDFMSFVRLMRAGEVVVNVQ